LPATAARKAGKRSIGKAKKVKNVALKRTKGIEKKSHTASKPVGRSASYKRSGAWAVKKKNNGKFPVHKKAEKIAVKVVAPRFYASEDIPLPFTRRNVAKPAKLRESITPGTVLILLAGRFRGKRVVFLKQLASGLLLVTGPFKINGVPLRRVNQAFTIATSTKVPTTGVNVDKIDDKYFAKLKTKTTKTADGFFKEAKKSEEGKDQVETPGLAIRKADQKAVDTALLATIKKTEFLKPYLNARFSLSKGDAPHAMKF